ncbi:MAG: hypothetical protein QXL67_02030 [Candidatus Bathyarchaeia archaeon]
MKQYVGVWTTKNEMVQVGYKESLEFYAECGVTSIVVGYEGSHPEYYKGLKLPLIEREETKPTLREICQMAGDVGLDVEVVIEPKNSVFAEKFPETAVTDVFGNRSTLICCPSNPDIMAYTKARIKDILENYEGVIGLELDGVYIDMHQRMTNRRGQPGALYPLHHLVPESCFCEHCRKLAEEEGLNLKQIEKTVKEVTESSLRGSPEDFYRVYDTFRGGYDIVRFILNHPEVVDWLVFRCKLVARSLNIIKETVKSINPKVKVFHDVLPPAWAWSMGQDYAGQKDLCDGYKIIFFNKRTGSFEVNPLIAIKDKIPEVPDFEIMDLFKRLTGYEGGLSFAEFSQQGFPPRNVYYEVKKARDEVGPNYMLIAGIVGDAPSTPNDVEEAVNMAAKGGADGFCLHTWYGRTTPSNYAAFGSKGRELAKPV